MNWAKDIGDGALLWMKQLVYLSWAETKAQAHQFSGQGYKGFDSLDEAREAFYNYQHRKGIR